MLVKNIFRTEIRELLLEQMVLGDLKPGDRISLPAFAKELEVSVTPVREALTQLTETGMLTYIANRGFFVTQLTESEARDIYDMIALLESDAMERSFFSAKQILELRALNLQFRSAKEAIEKLRLDMDFHQKLTENYPNQYALKIIENLRVRIFIYEHAFMSTEPVEDSADMHDDIISSLQAGEIDRAIEQLKANWQISVHHILQFYHSQNPLP